MERSVGIFGLKGPGELWKASQASFQRSTQSCPEADFGWGGRSEKRGESPSQPKARGRFEFGFGFEWHLGFRV